MMRDEAPKLGLFSLLARSIVRHESGRSFSSMNQLRKSSEGENRSRFAILRGPLSARWSPIPLRLIVGYGFMEHGFAKLSKGPENFAAILHALGVPAPHFMAWLTILTELIGGLAVSLGAFIPLVSFSS
jgi:putative oxidoreductase